VREDKRPEEVVRERAEAAPSSNGHGARSRGRARAAAAAATAAPSAPARRRPANKSGDDAEVAGVRISNPDRVLYPEQGVTKLALARYYEQVADHVLPHVTGRPISVVRCPRGATGPCFYQRHPGEGFPEDLVKHVRDRTSGGTYVWIDSLAGLVALVQMGVLEIHPWGSRADDLDRPDRMFFDLDPDPSVAWDEVVAAARLVRDVLAELGLESFVKTSGGKGLHVVVPLARRHDWDTVKGFSGAVARRIESAAPDRFLAKASKAARKGKIFIDWLRNARSATTVAAYSTRAKPAATVSMPVAWSELARVTGADAFTIESALQRIARRRADPWAGYFASRQTISASAQRALGTS
jgi:bifunctional non-homologous end joining protein LigD